jgi:multidrug efflux pump subunit AcrA (membrane-fusion protein)
MTPPTRPSAAAAANITQAEAQISQKEAAVSVAQTNLDHTVIRSPIDGTVVARNVDVGQTVAASPAGPDHLYDRAGSHQDVCVRQDRRVGRRQRTALRL